MRDPNVLFVVSLAALAHRRIPDHAKPASPISLYQQICLARVPWSLVIAGMASGGGRGRWDHSGPPGTTWDHLGPPGIAWDRMGSNRVPRDHSAPLPSPHELSVTLRCHQLRPPPLAIPAMTKLPPRPKWVGLATDRIHQKCALRGLGGTERRLSVPCVQRSNPERATANRFPRAAPRRWGGHVALTYCSHVHKVSDSYALHVRGQPTRRA